MKFVKMILPWILFGVLLVLVIGATATFGPRVKKDMEKKRGIANSYVIQNVGTGLDLRIKDASIYDGAPLVSYDHHEWECLTWQLIEVAPDTYLLKNLYTEKSFEIDGTPKIGATLSSQPIGGRKQMIQFVSDNDSIFRLRIKDTDLYLTPSSDKTDATVVLDTLRHGNIQQWRLLPQQPIL